MNCKDFEITACSSVKLILSAKKVVKSLTAEENKLNFILFSAQAKIHL